MSSGMSLSNLWPMLIGILPGITANVIGVMIASTQLSRLPRPAGLVLAGCGVNLFSYGATFCVRLLLMNGGLSGPNLSMVFGIVGFVSSLVYAVGLGLIISAAFVDRVPPRPPEEEL